MAYGNPGPMGGGGGGPVPGAMADEPMHDEGMHGEGGGGVIHIGADMLPKGMELNVGDIVEFKVTGPKDADGDYPLEYNYGNKGEGGEGAEGGEAEEGTSWEDDFRKSMSPRAGGGEGEQEAQ